MALSLRALTSSLGRGRLPEPAGRLKVVDGVLGPEHAKALASFARKHLDPRMTLTVLRGNHRNTGVPTDLNLEVKMPGAVATFYLEPPMSMNAQFGSPSWGRQEVSELLRLNANLVKGRLGEYLIEGRSGAFTWGGPAVDAAERARDVARAGGGTWY